MARRKSIVYILAQADEYELPLTIGFIDELARFTGERADNLARAAAKNQVIKKLYKVYKCEEE